MKIILKIKRSSDRITTRHFDSMVDLNSYLIFWELADDKIISIHFDTRTN